MINFKRAIYQQQTIKRHNIFKAFDIQWEKTNLCFASVSIGSHIRKAIDSISGNAHNSSKKVQNRAKEAFAQFKYVQA